jgi:hypothetical protein
LPVIANRMNTPSAGHHRAGATAGLGVEHRASGARVLLDHRPRERRADLLVTGEQGGHRCAHAAELLDRRQHETVHHQAGLHVGHTRAIGAVAVDPERPAGRLALGKHRVAMPHKQDRTVAAVADGRADGIAETAIGCHLGGDAIATEERANVAADRIDPGLIVGAAVGVHQGLEQPQHGGALAREPVEDRAFGAVSCHAIEVRLPAETRSAGPINGIQRRGPRGPQTSQVSGGHSAAWRTSSGRGAICAQRSEIMIASRMWVTNSCSV